MTKSKELIVTLLEEILEKTQTKDISINQYVIIIYKKDIETIQEILKQIKTNKISIN